MVWPFGPRGIFLVFIPGLPAGIVMIVMGIMAMAFIRFAGMAAL